MTAKDFLGPVLSLAMAIGGGSLVYVVTIAKLEAKVDAQGEMLDKLEKKLESKVDGENLREVKERLKGIEDKLDRVIERRARP